MAPNISQKAFLVRGTSVRRWESAPCVKVNESLSTSFTFRALRVQMKSCHFLFQFLSLCLQCHSQWLLSFFWSLQGNAPQRSTFLLFFPRTKIFRLWENGLPWNTQHPMKDFVLIWCSKLHGKHVRRINWELTLISFPLTTITSVIKKLSATTGNELQWQGALLLSHF